MLVSLTSTIIGIPKIQSSSLSILWQSRLTVLFILNLCTYIIILFMLKCWRSKYLLFFTIEIFSGFLPLLCTMNEWMYLLPCACNAFSFLSSLFPPCNLKIHVEIYNLYTLWYFKWASFLSCRRHSLCAIQRSLRWDIVDIWCQTLPYLAVFIFGKWLTWMQIQVINSSQLYNWFAKPDTVNVTWLLLVFSMLQR